MLDSLDVRNFQSLKSVHLDLGRLTVIVGDSNCGKSALIRSIQALASNVRGASVVTHGAKLASISASSESSKVTLEKGEGHGSYRLISVDGEKEFTKLAGEVPAEISSSLGLDPVRDGLSLNFASQHDPPFLLTTTGSSVARTLGELTKVSTVLEAVREANRQRSSSASELKLRTSDLEAVSKSLSVLDSLKSRKAAVLEVERLLAEVAELTTAIDSLHEAVVVSEKSDYEVVEPFDIGPALQQYQGLASLIELLTALQTADAEVRLSDSRLSKAFQLSIDLEVALHYELREAGTCPTCGQAT